MPLHKWNKWNKEHLLSREARTKSRMVWRNGVSALIGVYLLFSPLVLGTTGEPESTLNAILVGICTLTLGARTLLTGGSRATEAIRLALGGWLVLAPFALGFANSVAAGNAWLAGILLVATTDVAELISPVDMMLRTKSRSYRALRLSPETIAACESSEPGMQTVTPEALSGQIVECSERIRKTLLTNPSEAEIEMCILGYKSCVADMLLQEGLVERELPRVGPIRRVRLKAARHKAIHSLTKTRETLPPASVQTLYSGESGG